MCTEAVVELAISPEGATSLPVASATGLAPDTIPEIIFTQ